MWARMKCVYPLWLPGNTGFWGLRKCHPRVQAVINVVVLSVFGWKQCIHFKTAAQTPKHEFAPLMALTHHIPSLLFCLRMILFHFTKGISMLVFYREHRLRVLNWLGQVHPSTQCNPWGCRPPWHPADSGLIYHRLPNSVIVIRTARDDVSSYLVPPLCLKVKPQARLLFWRS